MMLLCLVCLLYKLYNFCLSLIGDNNNNQNLIPHRVLFADYKDREDLVKELFKLSGVQETLGAQQLTIEQFNQLCQSYDKLCNNIRSSSLESNNNRTTSEKHLITVKST